MPLLFKVVGSFELVCRAIEVGAIMESMLIIRGSMGAGKTSVLGEASDLLALRHITHAAIDLDTWVSHTLTQAKRKQ